MTSKKFLPLQPINPRLASTNLSPPRGAGHTPELVKAPARSPQLPSPKRKQHFWDLLHNGPSKETLESSKAFIEASKYQLAAHRQHATINHDELLVHAQQLSLRNKSSLRQRLHQIEVKGISDQDNPKSHLDLRTPNFVAELETIADVQRRGLLASKPTIEFHNIDINENKPRRTQQ